MSRSDVAGRVLDLSLLGFAMALPLSIAVSEILLGISILAWLATRPWTRAQAPGVRALAWASLALATTWLLASATSAEPLESLVHARKLYSIVLVLLLADRGRNQDLARRFTTAALVGGGVSAIVGLVLLVLGAQRESDLVGVFSTAMTSGNVFATLGVVALAAVLWRIGTVRERALHALSFVLLLAALVLSLRRSAWLAWLFGSATLIGLRRARWLLALPILLAIVLVFGPQSVRDRASLIANPVDATSSGRVSLWKSGWQAFLDHPVTGVGLQDGLELIAHYRRADGTFMAGHFHNNWVQIAVSTGTLGLVAYALWMGALVVFLWRAWRVRGQPLAAAGLAVWVVFQVHGLFDWSFGDIEVVNQFFAWSGLGLAQGAVPSGGFVDRGGRA